RRHPAASANPGREEWSQARRRESGGQAGRDLLDRTGRFRHSDDRACQSTRTSLTHSFTQNQLFAVPRPSLSSHQRSPQWLANFGIGVLAGSEARKFFHDALVNLTLEWNDQGREVLHRLPTPAHKFRLMAAAGGCHIDLAVVAGEPRREPFLPLAAIAPPP